MLLRRVWRDSQAPATHMKRKTFTSILSRRDQGPCLSLFSLSAMPILVCVSKEVSTSWVHRPQLPPFAQGLRGLSIVKILLHFSLGCPHQDPGAILPPFRISEGELIGVLMRGEFSRVEHPFTKPETRRHLQAHTSMKRNRHK